MLYKLYTVSIPFFSSFKLVFTYIIKLVSSNVNNTRIILQAIRNKISFPLTIFSPPNNILNFLFQYLTNNLMKTLKSFIKSTYETNYILIGAILNSNHCQGFPSHQYSNQIRKLMETYIITKTESLSHIVTLDLQLTLQRNRSLFIDDSKYSLSEIDFIELIEVLKTIIELPDTFNTFAKLIGNCLIYLQPFDVNRHDTFLRNIRTIYKF
jgi:hypothetical protein